jgi:hypothetical protein
VVRGLVLWGVSIAIGVVGLAAVGLSLWLWGMPWSLTDRFAAITAVQGAGALCLAIVAGGVALLSYAVTTGRPNLVLSLPFPFSPVNDPVFYVEPAGPSSSRLSAWKQNALTPFLENRSPYSARNPSVTVRLQGLAQIPPSPGWVAHQFVEWSGIVAVRWDGGADQPIHGGANFKVPELSLAGAHLLTGVPVKALIVDVEADGFKRRWEFPVRVVGDETAASDGRGAHRLVLIRWLRRVRPSVRGRA